MKSTSFTNGLTEHNMFIKNYIITYFKSEIQGFQLNGADEEGELTTNLSSKERIKK